MKLSKEEIENGFPKRGRPHKYRLEDLELHEVRYISCRPSEKDKQLHSARNIVSIANRGEKKFKVRAVETGVEVVRYE